MAIYEWRRVQTEVTLVPFRKRANGRHLVVAALALMAAGTAMSQNWYLASQAETSSYAGFVGTFLGIMELECPFPNTPFALPFNNENSIVDGCDGVMYRVQFKIDEVLEGELQVGDEVAFEVHEYDGTPELANYRNVLIFLGVGPDGLYYDGSSSEQVFPTEDGRHALCGCQYVSDESDVACPEIAFDPPVTVDLSYASQFKLDRFRQDEVYVVESTEAVCKRGQYVEDIYEDWNP